MNSVRPHTVDAGDFTLTWDPQARLAVLRASTDIAQGTGEAAAVFVAAFEGWANESNRPFGFLVDGERAVSSDSRWRSAFGAFFQKHKGRARIAMFHLNPVIGVVAEMFRLASGLTLKVFADEESARSWLQSRTDA